LFSRFGVMFFPEPERSFEALSRTLTSTGRVAFVCWRALAENPWMRAPYESVRATIGAPAQPPSEAPGPFAFARPERVRAILEGAGFVDVAAKAFDHDVIIGATIDDAVEFASTNGPAAILLATIEDAPARARAIAAIRAMLVAQAKGNGPLRMPGATWIVTARKARD
jgi:hypothetical protein